MAEIKYINHPAPPPRIFESGTPIINGARNMNDPDLDARRSELHALEAEALRHYEAIREERAHAEQKFLESQAEVIQYGDGEPDNPAGSGKRYRAANGYIFYWARDGWRWEGDCHYGHPWDRLPEGLFPMTELVGTQLVKPWR